MKVLLSAFQCSPGMGSEPGNGWHWATSLAEYGHDVTVLTGAFEREGIFAANPQGIDFRFIEPPKSFLRHVSTRFGSYQVYRRWQGAALEQAERTPRQWDVAHHVTWASLHLGSMTALSLRTKRPSRRGPGSGEPHIRAPCARGGTSRWSSERQVGTGRRSMR